MFSLESKDVFWKNFLPKSVGQVVSGCTLFIVSMLMVNVAVAREQFSPANFIAGGNLFKQKIVFPPSQNDISIRVACDASVSRSGKVLENFCFSSGDDELRRPFAKEVLRAAKGLRIEPARVNNKSMKVWFQYRVEFHRNANVESIRVFANNGVDVDRYGDNYISAQRYFKPRRSYFERCYGYVNLWATAHINDKGQPTEAKFVVGDGSDGCKKSIIRGLLASRYIPAFHNGEMVASNVLEMFFLSSLIRSG